MLLWSQILKCVKNQKEKVNQCQNFNITCKTILTRTWLLQCVDVAAHTSSYGCGISLNYKLLGFFFIADINCGDFLSLKGSLKSWNSCTTSVALFQRHLIYYCIFFHPFTHGFIALKYFPVAYREKCFPSYDSICNKQVLFVLFQLSSNTIQQTMTFLTCWETTPGVCYLSWRTFLQTCLWLNSCIFQSFSKLALKVLLHYRHQHTCTLTQVVFSSWKEQPFRVL